MISIRRISSGSVLFAKFREKIKQMTVICMTHGESRLISIRYQGRAILI